MTVADPPDKVDGMDDDGVRPGWRLYVECVVCKVDDTFGGFVLTQAVDRAVKAGWCVDREAVSHPTANRHDLCPKHHRRLP